MKIYRKAESAEMRATVEGMRRMSERAGMAFCAENGSLPYEKIRVTMEQGYANYPVTPGVSFRDFYADGIHMEENVPETLTDKENIVFYIHGGGFVCGSARLSRGIASCLAKDLGCRVFSVDYRLAPENKFPAGIDDCFTAYCALVKAFPNAKIALMGESAGATASIVTALRAHREGVRRPACVVPHSPVGTLEDIGREKYDTEDFVVGKSAFKAFEGMYYNAGEDLTNPDLSPLHGDFTDFPPVYMTCDEKETLSVDAEMYYDKMTAAGADVTLVVVSGAFHAFGATGRGTPEAAQALDEAEALIRKCFAR